MSGVKPAYRVPSMAEVRAIPWNGYTVASTFSGAGGSCLGYRLAGFRVVWANEFMPAAQDVYRLNHPDSILNTQDVRTLSGTDILDAVGPVDVLDGSPPCAAFSMGGKRQDAWDVVQKYSDGAQQVDDLFFEYARVLRELRPKVFIAENVKGLVLGKAKGYFKAILRVLRDAGYRVEARLLDAQYLGVPQTRERVFFMGVRADLGRPPQWPDPLPYGYTVRDALAGLPDATPSLAWYPPADGRIYAYYQHCRAHPRFRGYLTRAAADLGYAHTVFQHRIAWPNQPSPTIVQSALCVYHPDQPRSLSIAEVKRLMSFPDDFQLTGSRAQQWERLGRSVPPIMMQHVAQAVRTVLDG